MKTRAEAAAAGKQAQRQLPKGWKLRVWENLGWHYSLSKGNVRLLPPDDISDRWSCLISEVPTDVPGSGGPWTRTGGGWGETPREAVRKALRDLLAYVENQQKVLEDSRREAVSVAGELSTKRRGETQCRGV
jgi:hypothetical protein